jgi:hypothetical protein
MFYDNRPFPRTGRRASVGIPCLALDSSETLTVAGEGVAGEGRREVRRGLGQRPDYEGPGEPFGGQGGHGSGLRGRFEADQRRAAQKPPQRRRG